MRGRQLKYAMVGGGPGSFIGEVHRRAAELNGEAKLVAGAFSSDPEKSAERGEEFLLDPARVYGSYLQMVDAEAAREGGERVDFVVIVTPNHLHFDPARAFLESGFDVVCDKPLTTTMEDAEALCNLVTERGAIFAVTHNYTGYPMVKQARSMVSEGRLGRLRRIQVEYLQGWLATDLEGQGHRQASWRTDPARAGIAGALGDIGTHAHNLVRYVTGLEVEELCADITAHVPGRRLDDDASLLMRWTGGVRATLTASQVATGEENELVLRVYGDEASLVWRQEEPETLLVRERSGRRRLVRRGHSWLDPAASAASTMPPGHPEGFVEGFASLYAQVFKEIRARRYGEAPSPSVTPEPSEPDFPTVQDGARGVDFLHRAVESASARSWVDARYTPPGMSG